jgi:hypothetical protein
MRCLQSGVAGNRRTHRSQRRAVRRDHWREQGSGSDGLLGILVRTVPYGGPSGGTNRPRPRRACSCGEGRYRTVPPSGSTIQRPQQADPTLQARQMCGAQPGEREIARGTDVDRQTRLGDKVAMRSNSLPVVSGKIDLHRSARDRRQGGRSSYCWHWSRTTFHPERNRCRHQSPSAGIWSRSMCSDSCPSHPPSASGSGRGSGASNVENVDEFQHGDPFGTRPHAMGLPTAAFFLRGVFAALNTLLV